MSAYHQMGHHTRNLLSEPELAAYKGAILSPVNYTAPETLALVTHVREKRPDFDFVFDSQMYMPAVKKGQLPKWPYYPTAVVTGDTVQISWWRDVVTSLVACCSGFKPNAICSPIYFPNAFTDGFFDESLLIGTELVSALKGTSTRAVQTLLVSLFELTNKRAMDIASIASKTKVPDILLILECDVEPRREIRDTDPLVGGMRLIQALSKAGYNVTVACCSSDVLLWKSAGAANAATGKFFNLRRFTKSRFDEPGDSGGQNLPYWFEESLVAFLRDGDLVRLRAQNKLGPASTANPFATSVFQVLDARNAVPPGEDPPAWVRLGWRHYMYWFSDIERRLTHGESASALLKTAEAKWLELEDQDFLMEEPRNDGSWIRQWRRALVEFQKPLA